MAYSNDLSGRVAFITGASSGLGAQFARTLAGAAVVLASRRLDRLKELRAQIEGDGGDAQLVELDVSNIASIRSAVAHAETEVGSIHPDQQLGRQHHAAHAGARTRRGAGHLHGWQDRQYRVDGRLRVLPQIAVCRMSKAALVQMTKAMALEWSKLGINVNAICPGYIDTEINHRHWQTEQGKKLMQMRPRKRVGRARDLDAVLVILCANESHFINGAVIAAADGFGV